MSYGTEERKPLWARCVQCGHCWPVAYYPMQISKLATLLDAKCPNCAAAGVVIAEQDDGTLKGERRIEWNGKPDRERAKMEELYEAANASLPPDEQITSHEDLRQTICEAMVPWRRQNEWIEGRHKAEAKLAKAVEALERAAIEQCTRMLGDRPWCPEFYDETYPHLPAPPAPYWCHTCLARAALREIKDPGPVPEQATKGDRA